MTEPNYGTERNRALDWINSYAMDRTTYQGQQTRAAIAQVHATLYVGDRLTELIQLLKAK